MSKKYPWKCPKCSATADGCGKGACKAPGITGCMGLICECEGEQKAKHGDTVNDPCLYATCYHCGWGGTMPNVKAEDPIKLLKEILKTHPGPLDSGTPSLLDRIKKRVAQ